MVMADDTPQVETEKNPVQTQSVDQTSFPESPAVHDKYLKGLRLSMTVVALSFGTLLVAIDNTVIAVAIPKISSVFQALSDIGWYGSAYLLTVTALQPTCGRLYKYFSINITFLCSIIVFEGEISQL